MYFDVQKLDQARSYKLLASTIVPRPIAWVITVDRDGTPNAAPYSFFNFFSGFPPIVCIGMGLLEGKPKDSLAHIRANGQFAINLVPFELAEAMNITAVPFASGINELEKAGLRTLPCKYINGVRIEASPVCIECELADIVNVKPSSVIVMGHVRAVHIADEAITNPERLHIDASKLRLIGRMESPGWYTHTSQRFHMQQLNVAQWEQQSGK